MEYHKCVLLVIGALVYLPGCVRLVDGQPPLPLQQYYVIGRLQSVSSYNSCVNSTDSEIASNANPFLNCTLDGLLLNGPVVHNVAWLSNETIQVWWIFSEPVVVNRVLWTFDVNAGMGVVDRINVRQSTDGSHSNSKMLSNTNLVTTVGKRADFLVSLNSNAVNAAGYWIFEFLMLSESKKVVLVQGLPNITLAMETNSTSTSHTQPNSSPTPLPSSSPTPLPSSTPTSLPSSSPTSIPGSTPDNTSDQDTTVLYAVVGVLGSGICILTIVVIVIISIFVARTKRTILVRSGKNTPAEAIYSEPNGFSPRSISFPKDPAYSGSTGSHPYDEPHLPVGDYTNCRRMSPVYAEPEKMPNGVSKLLSLPSITLLSTGSDPALAGHRFNMLGTAKEYSLPELIGSTKSLTCKPSGQSPITPPDSSHDNVYRTLEGSCSGDDSSDDEMTQKEFRVPSEENSGYAVLEQGDSDEEQQDEPNSPVRNESAASKVMLISCDTDVDSPTEIKRPNLSTEISKSAPTLAQLEVDLMYTQISKVKKEPTPTKQLQPVTSHDYAETEIVTASSNDLSPHVKNSDSSEV